MVTYDYDILLNKDKQRRLAFIMLQGGSGTLDARLIMDGLDSLPSKTVKKLVDILSLGNRHNSNVNILERLLTLKDDDFKRWVNIAYRNAKHAYPVQGDYHEDHIGLVDSVLWHSQSKNLSSRQERNIVLSTAAALSVLRNEFELFMNKDITHEHVPLGTRKGSFAKPNSLLVETNGILHNKCYVLSSQPLINFILEYKGDSGELHKAIISSQSVSPERVAAVLASQSFAAPAIAEGAL